MVCVLTSYQNVLAFFGLKDLKWLDSVIVQTNLDSLQNYSVRQIYFKEFLCFNA